ncbi:hypothetical protein PQX77_002370, partial [Marasmius sp. AFHP31]
MENMYFKRADWPEEWINTAIDTVKSLWKDYYKTTNNTETQERSTINVEHKNKFLDDDDEFTLLSSGDALDDWLSVPPISTAGARNPISWWKSDYLKENQWCKPLQRMALNVLSCP